MKINIKSHNKGTIVLVSWDNQGKMVMQEMSAVRYFLFNVMKRIVNIFENIIESYYFNVFRAMFIGISPILCIFLFLEGMFICGVIVLIVLLYLFYLMYVGSVRYGDLEFEKIVNREYQFEKPKIENDRLIFEGKYYNLDDIKKCVISHYRRETKIGRSGNELITFDYTYSGADLEYNYIYKGKICFIEIERVCGTGFFRKKYDIYLEIPFLFEEESSEFLELILKK